MGFHHGISGLKAASKQLDVLGHNIANSSTVGFKRSRAEFNEMVASAMGTCCAGQQPGTGVSVADIAQQFTQGTNIATENGLDMAVNGNGFFVVNTPGGQAYTRSGNFQLTKDGEIVTVNGDKVLGFPVDPTTGRATSTTTLQPLGIPVGMIPAKETTTGTVVLNMDARAITPGRTGVATTGGQTTYSTQYAAGAEPTPPRTTYGTAMEVFDAQGVPTSTGLYFQKADKNAWAMYNGLDNTTRTDGKLYPPVGFALMNGDGTLKAVASIPAAQSQPLSRTDTFPASRTYTASYTDTTGRPQNVTIKVTWGAFDATSPTFEFTQPAGEPDGTPTSTTLALSVENKNPNNPKPPPINMTLDLAKVTQFGRNWNVEKITQNGYSAGEVTKVNVSDSGVIEATYSNGMTRAEGQVALARFTNMQGLRPEGNNNWAATTDAGPVVLGQASSPGFGTIEGSMLEQSNVDLTDELVGLMTAQRYYQANAQTIKTQDQVFSTLVNLR